MNINDLTGKVIGAAIEVHKHLGPGLLESAYEECLCHELRSREIVYERQKPLAIKTISRSASIVVTGLILLWRTRLFWS